MLAKEETRRRQDHILAAADVLNTVAVAVIRIRLDLGGRKTYPPGVVHTAFEAMVNVKYRFAALLSSTKSLPPVRPLAMVIKSPTSVAAWVLGRPENAKRSDKT